MTYYIIYSGQFVRWLPEPKDKKSKTTVEPTNSYPPRLFKRKGDAKQALAWWLEGKVFMNREGCIDIMPVKGRDKWNFKVTEIHLHIIER